jgi:hypothetical protein
MVIGTIYSKGSRNQLSIIVMPLVGSTGIILNVTTSSRIPRGNRNNVFRCVSN